MLLCWPRAAQKRGAGAGEPPVAAPPEHRTLPRGLPHRHTPRHRDGARGPLLSLAAVDALSGTREAVPAVRAHRGGPSRCLHTLAGHLCAGRRRRGAASSLSGISRPDACRVFNPCAARGRSMRRAASCSSASSRPGGCRRTRRVSTSSSSSPASRTATRRRAPTPTLPRSLCLAGQGPAAARCGGRSPAVRGARVLLCLLSGSASAPLIRRDSTALCDGGGQCAR